MFKSLRNGFIRMNMLVISLVVLVSFCAVYILVYSNIRREVWDELEMLLNLPDMPGERPLPNREGEAEAPGAERPPFANVPRMGFVVKSQNGDCEITLSRLFVEAGDLDIPALLEKAAGDAGRVAKNGYVWAYRARREESGAAKVAFVEIGESRVILANLVRIFLAIGAALLVAIGFISRWFARRSVAPIEKAFNSQRRFIQDASHDLKTPVAVIRTNLELLRAYPGESAALKDEWLSNIQTENTRMERMTAQLLALARTETERPKPGAVFSLTDLVRNCVLPMEAVLYEKNLRFESAVAEGVALPGCPDDIEKLVHILMENAIEYTPAQGGITLSLRGEKRRAVLRVANTGAGIPAEDLPHVFERFYRGDGARGRGQNNCGLGLAIAQGIVQRHRGTIAVESAAGAETVFTVCLPL